MKSTKLISLVLVSLFAATTISAQHYEELPRKELHIPDDNYYGSNVGQYVGQKLQVACKYLPLQKYGYSGFLNDYQNNIRDSLNIYNCCQDKGTSKIEGLTGRVFTVEEIIADPNPIAALKGYGDRSYLLLKADDNGDQVYYEYYSAYETSFPFIRLDYIEELKERYIGQEIVVRGKNWIIEHTPMKHYQTDQVIKFDAGSNWKCVDISTDVYNCRPSLLLESSNGDVIPMNVTIAEEENPKYFFTKAKAEEYQKQFGNEAWNAIVGRVVSNSFTPEMTRISLGEPDLINMEDGNKEIWIYRNKTLTFVNGKLSKIAR